jgi:acetyl-CoA acetyltransferase
VPKYAAIAGIGQTEFSKNSGRSELQLAAEASKAALDDAGIHPADVDGMITFTLDPSDEITHAASGRIAYTTRIPRRRSWLRWRLAGAAHSGHRRGQPGGAP